MESLWEIIDPKNTQKCVCHIYLGDGIVISWLGNTQNLMPGIKIG